jgi:hypothetical protein
MKTSSRPSGGRISNVRADVASIRAVVPVTFVLEPAETAGVRCDVEHAFGVTGTVVESPVSSGSSGRGEFQLDLRCLPRGPATIRVTPLNAAGRAGASGEVNVEIPGCPGLGPAVIDFHAVDRCLKRPQKSGLAIPRFCLLFQDRGVPVTGAYFTLEGPDGSREFGEVAPPTGGTSAPTPFTLGADRELGAYRAVAILVDADGNASEPAEAMIEVASEGAAAPEVERVTWRRRDGTIVVTGSGFDSTGVQALVGGQLTPILSVARDKLIVLAPPLTGPAEIEIRSDGGSGKAPRPITPPIALEIVPAELRMQEGTSVQLHASVHGTSEGAVEWSVDDDPPGVSVDSGGVLAVTHAAPDAFRVRVRHSAKRSATATATVRVGPPEGVGVAVGPRGGTVTSEDGGAVLRVPADAVATPTSVGLRPASSRLGGRGREIIAEVRLRPAPLNAPAELVVPTRSQVTPGSQVEGRVLSGDKWSPVDGTADDSGFFARFQLDNLPERLQVLHTHLPHGGMHVQADMHPVIRNVQPAAIEEGDTVAVLVEGANFVPGLTAVTALTGPGGAVDPRVECRGAAISRTGTRLGVTVHVSTLTDLAEGQVSGHVLRVQTPVGSDEFPLSVIGHDELRVPAGSTVTVAQSGRFSELLIEAGGTLNIASRVPPLTIDVLGSGWMAGDIRVLAASGAAGGTGVSAGSGGTGGVGVVGSGGAGGVGGRDGTVAGVGGAPGSATAMATPAGAGGLGGSSGGGGPLPHLGGDGSKGGSPPNPHIVGPSRSSIAPVPAVGAGGGGGGGGGGEGFVFTNIGGGGGGGGAGGGGAWISFGNEVRMNGGKVFAVGGDGGSGGSAGATPPSGFVYISAGQGGGGGGGSGGAVVFSGVSSQSPLGYVVAVSGAQGMTPGQTVQVNTLTLLQTLLTRPPTGDIRVDGFLMGASRPTLTAGPDVWLPWQLVVTEPQVEVRGTDASHVRVTNGFGTTLFPIDGTITNVFTSANSIFTATVPLIEGFNDVTAELPFAGTPGPGLPSVLDMASAPLRRRRFLHLADTIPFYEFSCTISPTSLTVPTERAASVTASFTATQPTTLVWEVPSAPDGGTVMATSTGARYEAPRIAPPGGSSVRASSGIYPTLSTSIPVTVLPGIAVNATATAGTAANPALPSANCGQTVEIVVPPAVYAITGQGFANVTAVQCPLLQPKTGGGCDRSTYAAAPTIAPGALSLTVVIPACADPDGYVRVPGHGAVRLQIVPTITALEGDPAADPGLTIRGTGFACGNTQVLVGGNALPDAEILSLQCGTIQVKTRPTSGASLAVRTSGGVSAPVTVP